MPPMGSRRIREKADLTPAVYAALVDSLFQNPGADDGRRDHGGDRCRHDRIQDGQ